MTPKFKTGLAQLPWAKDLAEVVFVDFYSHAAESSGSQYSNLFKCQVAIDTSLPVGQTTFFNNPCGRVTFSSTENAFQCAKMASSADAQVVASLSSMHAARAGQGRGGQERLPMRADWEEIKLDVMAIALRSKFCQHPNLWAFDQQESLPPFFIEHTDNDRQWGDSGNGAGTNFLGKLLTALYWEAQKKCIIDRDNLQFETWMRTSNAYLVDGFYEH